MHAWVLARANQKHALDEYLDALYSDGADVQDGTTAEGIHLAAMAGTVHVLQRCFAGVDVSGDVLLLDPWRHGQLGTLQFGILYRGHVVTVTIADHTAIVPSGPGSQAPVTVRCQQAATRAGQRPIAAVHALSGIRQTSRRGGGPRPPRLAASPVVPALRPAGQGSARGRISSSALSWRGHR